MSENEKPMLEGWFGLWHKDNLAEPLLLAPQETRLKNFLTFCSWQPHGAFVIAPLEEPYRTTWKGIAINRETVINAQKEILAETDTTIQALHKKIDQMRRMLQYTRQQRDVYKAQLANQDRQSLLARVTAAEAAKDCGGKCLTFACDDRMFVFSALLGHHPNCEVAERFPFTLGEFWERFEKLRERWTTYKGDLPSAVAKLREELAKDEDLFFTYQSSIAMAFIDEWQNPPKGEGDNIAHLVNRAAIRFLNQFIGRPTSKPEEVVTVELPPLPADATGWYIPGVGFFDRANNFTPEVKQ